MPGRNYNAGDYRLGFNGKEMDNEIQGIGNSYDYGMRMYDSRIGRPISVDPLSNKYPELSPYQFISNNPIWFIDLDGLEGVQYLETMTTADGTTIIKRIVEVNIFVATSQNAKSIHFKSSDLPRIESDLSSEYNKGFKDLNDNIVEFRFRITELDADKNIPSEFAKQLRRDPDNFENSINSRFIGQKSFVLEKGKLKGIEQGKTIVNHVTISKNALDPSHTIAHETGHMFLNYDMSINPSTTVEHNLASGIFQYRVIDENGLTITPIQNVNQENIHTILKSVPEVLRNSINPK